MQKGTEKVPNIKSANAMFITRNKLFLRSGLVTAKRTRASKFPAMIRTEDNIKTLHNAMPSNSEGKRFANSDAFCRLSFTTDVSIIVNLKLSELRYTVDRKKEAVIQRRSAQPFAIKQNKISWNFM